MNGILEWLNSTAVIISIATIMIIAFSKCIIKIFRMGATFKADLASRDELLEFESEVKKDMRGYAIQIQESVQKSNLLIIENKLKDIDGIKNSLVEMKVLKAEIDATAKTVKEQLGEMKSVLDTVRSLNARIQRLEQDSMAHYGTSRRTE